MHYYSSCNSVNLLSDTLMINYHPVRLLLPALVLGMLAACVSLVKCPCGFDEESRPVAKGGHFGAVHSPPLKWSAPPLNVPC